MTPICLESQPWAGVPDPIEEPLIHGREVWEEGAEGYGGGVPPFCDVAHGLGPKAGRHLAGERDRGGLVLIDDALGVGAAVADRVEDVKFLVEVKGFDCFTIARLQGASKGN